MKVQRWNDDTKIRQRKLFLAATQTRTIGQLQKTKRYNAYKVRLMREKNEIEKVIFS